jgi:hypothetical protein
MDPNDELEQLRARVAHLESLVERLTASQPAVRREPAPASEGGLDRRRMLRKGLGLSAAAVAGVGALDALGSTAAAADGDAILVGQSVSPSGLHSLPTRLFNGVGGALPTLMFQVDNTTGEPPTATIPTDLTIAMAGRTSGLSDIGTTKVGVFGITEFGSGVRGDSDNGIGVEGRSALGGPGVKGHSATDSGVWGVTDNAAMAGVLGTNDAGQAVAGISKTGTGVSGTGAIGVSGISQNIGVVASGSIGLKATGTPAVEATSNGTAVHAVTTGVTPAVHAEGLLVAVRGTSTQDVGVWGESSSPNAAGVLGSNEVGEAVVGLSISSTGTVGFSTDGYGMRAESRHSIGLTAIGHSGAGISATSETAVAVKASSTSGPGVDASSTKGIGGSFEGGRAAIRLVPRSTVGAPTTGAHGRGEIVVDHEGQLWLCTRPGTPGTWQQLAFV